VSFVLRRPGGERPGSGARGPIRFITSGHSHRVCRPLSHRCSTPCPRALCEQVVSNLRETIPVATAMPRGESESRHHALPAVVHGAPYYHSAIPRGRPIGIRRHRTGPRRRRGPNPARRAVAAVLGLRGAAPDGRQAVIERGQGRPLLPYHKAQATMLSPRPLK